MRTNNKDKNFDFKIFCLKKYLEQQINSKVNNYIKS